MVCSHDVGVLFVQQHRLPVSGQLRLGLIKRSQIPAQIDLSISAALSIGLPTKAI
jgi:hypothetical protein